MKDSGIVNRKEGSGRSRSVTTEENTDLIEELICSPEEAPPHTHLAPRKIAAPTGISRSSIRWMIKRRHLSSIQKDKNVCRNRRYARAIALAEKLERNTRIIEITLWQDERNFPLYGPVNLKNDRV